MNALWQSLSRSPRLTSSASILSLLGIVILGACTYTQRVPSLPDEPQRVVAPPDCDLVVRVASAYDSRPLNGVHVFVLSASGEILIEGTTRVNGFVYLPTPEARRRPAFVLAEEPNHFLGGDRWDPRRCEYFIQLAPGAVM